MEAVSIAVDKAVQCSEAVHSEVRAKFELILIDWCTKFDIFALFVHMYREFALSVFNLDFLLRIFDILWQISVPF